MTKALRIANQLDSMARDAEALADKLDDSEFLCGNCDRPMNLNWTEAQAKKEILAAANKFRKWSARLKRKES